MLMLESSIKEIQIQLLMRQLKHRFGGEADQEFEAFLNRLNCEEILEFAENSVHFSCLMSAVFEVIMLQTRRGIK